MHKGDNLVQIGVEHIGCLKFRFIFRGAAKGLSSSCAQGAPAVSAGGSCSGQGQGIGVPLAPFQLLLPLQDDLGVEKGVWKWWVCLMNNCNGHIREEVSGRVHW